VRERVSISGRGLEDLDDLNAELGIRRPLAEPVGIELPGLHPAYRLFPFVRGGNVRLLEELLDLIPKVLEGPRIRRDVEEDGPEGRAGGWIAEPGEP